MEMSRACDLECTYDGFVWSFSPGASLDVVYSKEIINSLSLTRRMFTVCILRLVQSGLGSQVLARREEQRSKKEQKADFYRVSSASPSQLNHTGGQTISDV